jgi:hypothetical protein
MPWLGSFTSWIDVNMYVLKTKCTRYWNVIANMNSLQHTNSTESLYSSRLQTVISHADITDCFTACQYCTDANIYEDILS